jgi:hypothetical protein
MSLWLVAVNMNASGRPEASVRRWCFEPDAATIDWGRPRVEPPKSARIWLESATVRDQSISPARCRRLSSSWPALPHAGLLPLPQPPPARHARAVTKLRRQVVPRDPRVQHVQVPVQRLAIIKPPTTGMTAASRPKTSPRPTVDHNDRTLRHPTTQPLFETSSKGKGLLVWVRLCVTSIERAGRRCHD